MVVQGKKRLALALAVIAVAILPSFAQKTTAKKGEESIVRLVEALSIEQTELAGTQFRKAVKATFLHNGMYLTCDTAVWNLDSKVINANGHVKIRQGDVTLTSDEMVYDIELSEAQFQGTLVQLQDKKKNTLRTMWLTYNTRDSIAVFHNGASMTGDNQVIESMDGTYSSGSHLFSFTNEVNMFTDSIFVASENIEYDTEDKTAYFVSTIDFWKEDNMLSSEWGWYNRPTETFYFQGHVHMMTQDQEAWSDSMYFYRGPNDALMLGNAQMHDPTRNLIAVGQSIMYEDSLATITMTDQAAVAIRTESENGAKVDTVYCGADSLIYYVLPKCDIDSIEFRAAESRLADMLADPIASYRKKVADEAAEAAAQAAKEKALREGIGLGKPHDGDELPPATPDEPEDQNAPEEPDVSEDAAAPEDNPDGTAETADEAAEQTDELAEQTEDLAEQTDDAAEPADSVVVKPAPDSTKIGFLYGKGDVKVFRKDIQMRCDSLRYSDIDSIARFYVNPVVWNEGNRQYSADSLFALVKGGGVDRVSLNSNALIITQEDSTCFDQIKSLEVMAYFNKNAELRRFDALGGASAIFYLEENDALATVNKVEAKMLSAKFKDGDLEQVNYFDKTDNNAFPVVQLPDEDRLMKGFNWQPERRPASRYDITKVRLKKSARMSYESRHRPGFPQTERFFKGHMDKIYKSLEHKHTETAAPALAQDTVVTVPVDTVVVREVDSVAVKETVQTPVDSTVVQQPQLTEQEVKKAERDAAREARWAKMDRRDAEKAEARRQKALKRQRERTRRELIRQQRREAREQAKLQRYIEIYQRQKDGKEKSEPSGERASRTETR